MAHLACNVEQGDLMDTVTWWSTWAPVWDLMEDRHFGTSVTESLMDQIQSGVLIIGAGQGLIVRHLARKGLSAIGLDINPEMVQIAKKKYNLDIIEGDAGSLPFEKETFSTVIISSGVVDYGADESMIATFINEAKRVCRPGGKILMAFYRISEPIEKIYKRIGIIDSHNVYHMTRIFDINEIAAVSPTKCMPLIQKWTGKNRLRVGFEWAWVGLSQPKEFMGERDWINNIFTKGEELGLSRKTLLDSVPDTLPYRTKKEIEALLGSIHVEYKEIREFYDCSVVVIERT
jgi:ubiquinone/menaquinone biosynthesis C-methylase UbiE